MKDQRLLSSFSLYVSFGGKHTCQVSFGASNMHSYCDLVNSLLHNVGYMSMLDNGCFSEGVRMGQMIHE